MAAAGQAQTQHAGAQPIDGGDLGRLAIPLRVEGVHLQVLDHLALTGQAPALLTLLGAQGIGRLSLGRPCTHCTRQA
jgi:hypothetical protein